MTCLVSRGVYLEALDSLELKHIEHALRWTYARHTRPNFYLSDNNAPIFTHSKHDMRSWRFDHLETYPRYSPWQGGSYKRLISLTKTSLDRCFRDIIFLGPVQFRTTLAEIENIINSRPITHNTVELNLTPITPNDILRIKYIVPPDTDAIPANSSLAQAQLQSSCEYIDETVQQFWCRWKSEYLQFLRNWSAHQQFKKAVNPKIPCKGDVVIISEKNQKRRRWKLGIVTEPILSSDNSIRAAKIKLATHNIVVHPVQDLYHLELNEIDDQNSTPESNHETDYEVISIQLDDDFHSTQESDHDDDAEVISIQLDDDFWKEKKMQTK